MGESVGESVRERVGDGQTCCLLVVLFFLFYCVSIISKRNPVLSPGVYFVKYCKPIGCEKQREREQECGKEWGKVLEKVLEKVWETDRRAACWLCCFSYSVVYQSFTKETQYFSPGFIL